MGETRLQRTLSAFQTSLAVSFGRDLSENGQTFNKVIFQVWLSHPIAMISFRRREYFFLSSAGPLLIHFIFSSSLEESNRKAVKSTNTNGAPIKLQSKILAIAADPSNSRSVYIAESAGTLRRVVLEVGEEEPS